MSNGFQRYNTEYVLRDYFKDRDTFNFKYGLQYGLSSNLNGTSNEHAIMNLDEDPTILGFDLVILDKSPLFNEVNGFLDFGDSKNLTQISNKRNIYDDFVTQFAKFFNVDDRVRGEFKSDSRFNSFKTHYLNSIENLDKLVHYTGIGDEQGRQMTDFANDKLTINLSEDVGLNAGYLASAYRNFIYSKKDGRQVIPENLLRFDMVVIISEIRKFNRVSNAMSKILKDNSAEHISVFNDYVSRYMFTLHDCQLDFNSYSFGDSINQAGFGASTPGISEGLSFDIYYKYVSHEMEKFDFRTGTDNRDAPINDEVRYINDRREDVTTFKINNDEDSSINQETPSSAIDKLPSRPYDIKFHMNSYNNSSEGRSFEYDFPMLNPNYERVKRDIRRQVSELEENQTPFERGLNSIIDRTNQQLQTKFREARSQLISDLAAKVRETTGIRNIAAPRNVYTSQGLGNFILGKVGDFANLGLSTALGKGTSYLDKLAQGAEKPIFEKSDNLADKITGRDSIDNNSYDKYSNKGEIPNVYKK